MTGRLSPVSPRQLQRGSLGAIGKAPATSSTRSHSHEPQEEFIDKHYGREATNSYRKKKRKSYGDYESGLGFNLRARVPLLILAILILVAGVIKLGGCTMDNALRALKLNNEHPAYDNPHFNFYQQ